MSSPNPDNYARGSECCGIGGAVCGPGGNGAPPPVVIQEELDRIDGKITVLQDTNRIISASGDISTITAEQASLMHEGSIVKTSNGNLYVWQGVGDPTSSLYYLPLADNTPSGVTPGVYGEVDTVPKITINSQGQITSAENKTIAFPSGVANEARPGIYWKDQPSCGFYKGTTGGFTYQKGTDPIIICDPGSSSGQNKVGINVTSLFFETNTLTVGGSCLLKGVFSSILDLQATYSGVANRPLARIEQSSGGPLYFISDYNSVAADSGFNFYIDVVGSFFNPIVQIGTKGLISRGANNVTSCSSLGENALSRNTGSFNSAFGTESLKNNLEGTSNTSFGYRTLLNASTYLPTGAISSSYIDGGSGYTTGTYTSVSLLYASGATFSTPPLATITVSGGRVTAVNITSRGSPVDSRFRTSVDYSYITAASSSIGGSGTGFRISTYYLTVSASENTGIGSEALSANLIGNHNTAAGNRALYNVTAGSSNSAFGLEALKSISGSGNNSAFGRSALGSINGANNSAFGTYALSGNTGGDSNVGIGHNVASSSLTVSNEVNIYNGSVTARFQGAASAWTFASDARDKTEIEDLSLGLNFVTQLKPRKFKWAMRGSEVDQGKPAAGFIAQELLDVVSENEAMYTGLVDTNDPERYTVANANLIPILVKAVQELSQKIKKLEDSK
jgi:hypothetical protein